MLRSARYRFATGSISSSSIVSRPVVSYIICSHASLGELRCCASCCASTLHAGVPGRVPAAGPDGDAEAPVGRRDARRLPARPRGAQDEPERGLRAESALGPVRADSRTANRTGFPQACATSTCPGRIASGRRSRGCGRCRPGSWSTVPGQERAPAVYDRRGHRAQDRPPRPGGGAPGSASSRRHAISPHRIAYEEARRGAGADDACGARVSRRRRCRRTSASTLAPDGAPGRRALREWVARYRAESAPARPHFAMSTARLSRITVTLICPGYSSSRSISRAISWESIAASSSLTAPGVTITRISRPACIA